MAREEAAVLPLLAAGLCTHEQRAMVWRTLRAMPLRLLERMLPWLAGARAPPARSLAAGQTDLPRPCNEALPLACPEGRSRRASREPNSRPSLHTQAVGTESCSPDRRRARAARQAS
jgi:zinc finger-like protein